MSISGEMFLVVNFLSNSLSLWLASRLSGNPPPAGERLCGAALCGTLYGIMAYLPGLEAIRTLPFLLLCGFGMARLMYPRLRPLLFMKAAILTIFCGLLLSGVGAFLMQQGLSAWMAYGFLFLSILAAGFFCSCRISPRSKITMVEIGREQLPPQPQMVRLPAMLDTGNQLMDPITGLPVVVASPSALRPLLPYGLRPDNPETLPLGFRLLSVQTTAGHKLMMCFRPSQFRVQSEGVWHESQALIAIAPTGYDGAQALVPYAVVEALS